MKNAGRCPDPPRNFLKEVSWNFKNFCKKFYFFVQTTADQTALPEQGNVFRRL